MKQRPMEPKQCNVRILQMQRVNLSLTAYTTSQKKLGFKENPFSKRYAILSSGPIIPFPLRILLEEDVRADYDIFAARCVD